MCKAVGNLYIFFPPKMQTPAKGLIPSLSLELGRCTACFKNKINVAPLIAIILLK